MFSVETACALSINTAGEGDLPKMIFVNNTSHRAGHAIYGIVLSQLLCTDTEDFNPLEVVSEVVSISPSNNAVSSTRSRVCLCRDNRPNCLSILAEENPQLKVYPGQKFTISAADVGFNFAPSHGSLFARLLNSTTAEFEFNETSFISPTIREVAEGCSDLEYTIYSYKNSEVVMLTADGRAFVTNSEIIRPRINLQNENNFADLNIVIYEDIINNPVRYYSYSNNSSQFLTDKVDIPFELAGNVIPTLQTIPVFISVTVLNCPPGFILSDDPIECTCHPQLVINNITCDIDTQTVRRSGFIWVYASNETGVIVDHECPNRYCNPEVIDVNLTKPDTQCAFNRSGTLCGACKPGLSLALGSPQCLQCSNRNISLLIVFALAGLALVFLIKVLNLTVAEGTLKGFIFYVNIIKAAEPTFFPAANTRSPQYLFIAWANLDFGIESCFIDGLNGYWKSWLQFAFPFYVWLIAILIIVVSHYSVRATKIFGNNSVPVLATLFLLSYAKLLRNLINVFELNFISQEGIRSVVWAYDANVPLISVGYGFLFSFSVFVAFLMSVYVVILLSAYCLRKCSHRRGLKWLVPFYDTTFAPLKDKHYYWVGVLLLVRTVLFGLFAITSNYENVNALLVAVTSICLIFLSLIGRFHKKFYISILENTFFLNLGILATGTIFVNSGAGGSQAALVETSVAIAGLEFFGVCLLHIYRFVYLKLREEWSKHKGREKPQGRDLLPARTNSTSLMVVNHSTTSQVIAMSGTDDSSSFEVSSSANQKQQESLQYMVFTELREPLLDS